MRAFRTFSRDQRGVTLVELLIASFLTILVGAAAMEFYVSQHKAWLIETDVSEIQQNARAALDEIATKMKMGGYQVGVHPAFEVGQDSIIVYYRNDSTAHIDTVSYFVDASNPLRPWLMRQINGESAEPYAENVEQMSMTILSSRLIEVSLIARSGRPDSTIIDGDGYRRRTLTTQVRVRNM
jgi:Tfp pilus assembly protein PilW